MPLKKSRLVRKPKQQDQQNKEELDDDSFAEELSLAAEQQELTQPAQTLLRNSYRGLTRS